MPFPANGWPPRPASAARTFRFFESGTGTANFSDNAFLFGKGGQAWATIGEGDVDRLVFVSVDTAGVAGNDYSIEVVRPTTGHPVSLSAVYDPVGSDHIKVTLETLAGGQLDDTANTATLVAAAIDALADISSFANGAGTTALTKGEARKSFFGAGTLIATTSTISHGDTTTIATVGGGRVVSSSPLGSGKPNVARQDPYSPPEPHVWASTILVNNDGAADLEVSFDGINVHGLLQPSEEKVYRGRREAGISVRGVTDYRIEAW
jgi:hypothetical protein